MGFFDRLSRFLLGPGEGRGVDELAYRLGTGVAELEGARPRYREFTIPKRSGGARTIFAPDAELKRLQRRILHRLIARLSSHPAATGFEKGRSIVTHAVSQPSL